MAVLPEVAPEVGERVRLLLRDERALRLATACDGGREPDPSPVWFVPQQDGVLLYVTCDEGRLERMRSDPVVELHLDGPAGAPPVVLIGRARFPEEYPPAAEHVDYLAKYRADMIRVSGDLALFSAFAATPVIVAVDEVRAS